MSLDYNHSLFIQEFQNHLESMGYKFKNAFKESDKGDRFYFTNNIKKAAGRYKFIPAHKSQSGYPMIMWTIFSMVSKKGSGGSSTVQNTGSSSTTNYFWYKPNEDNLSKRDRERKAKELAEKYKKIQKERAIEYAKQQKEFRLLAQKEYKSIKMDIGVNKHPYLVRKKIKATYGVVISNQNLKIPSFFNDDKEVNIKKVFTYISKGDLIIPSLNINSEFMTYQVIRSDGSKRQRVDISTVGAFFTIGRLSSKTKRIFLCEGYATANSLYRAVNEPNTVVASCFDVENVFQVASDILKKYPTIQIVFCTDNDRQKNTKVGLFKGFDYAYHFNQPFIFPKFKDIPENDGKSDWNDLAEVISDQEIAEIVKKQIDYFYIVGKVQAIKAASESYGISHAELIDYALNLQNKRPHLFCEFKEKSY